MPTDYMNGAPKIREASDSLRNHWWDFSHRQGKKVMDNDDVKEPGVIGGMRRKSIQGSRTGRHSGLSEKQNKIEKKINREY